VSRFCPFAIKKSVRVTPIAAKAMAIVFGSENAVMRGRTVRARLNMHPIRISTIWVRISRRAELDAHSKAARAAKLENEFP